MLLENVSLTWKYSERDSRLKPGSPLKWSQSFFVLSKKAFYIPTRMTPVLLRNNANIGLAKSLIKIVCFVNWRGICLTLAQEVILVPKKGNDVQCWQKINKFSYFKEYINLKIIHTLINLKTFTCQILPFTDFFLRQTYILF